MENWKRWRSYPTCGKPIRLHRKVACPKKKWILPPSVAAGVIVTATNEQGLYIPVATSLSHGGSKTTYLLWNTMIKQTLLYLRAPTVSFGRSMQVSLNPYHMYNGVVRCLIERGPVSLVADEAYSEEGTMGILESNYAQIQPSASVHHPYPW